MWAPPNGSIHRAVDGIWVQLHDTKSAPPLQWVYDTKLR
jgi:hypothetical protein